MSSGPSPGSDQAPLSGKSLRDATFSGVRWISMGRLAADVIAFAGTTVLAHLIPPAEYGRVAIALIVNSIAIGLASEGFGNPLVQRESIARAHVESALFMSVAFGLLLTVGTFLLAPVVCEPLFGQKTAELVQLASPLFVLEGIAAVPHGLLQRRLHFQRVSVNEIAGVATGTITAVALAIAGLDAEAVVLGVIAGTVVGLILLLVAAPVPLPRIRPREMREIAAFGVPASLSSMTHVGFQNVDYAILGARLGAAPLGFYYRAFTLGMNYQVRISSVMVRVAFPIYSRTESRDQLQALRGRIARVNAAVIFPLLAMLVATAPLLIPWLFGARWEPAVWPTQLLAIAGMASAVGNGFGPVMLAAGELRWLLIYNVGLLVVYAAAVFVASTVGVTAVCLAVIVVSACAVVFGYVLLERLLEVPLRSLWSDVAPGAVSSLALLALALPLRKVMSELDIPALPALVAAGVAGFGAYFLVLRTLFRSAWSDVSLLARRMLASRRRGRDVSPVPVPTP